MVYRLVKAKIKHSMQAAHAERCGHRGSGGGGGSWFTAKRNVKRYLFAAAAALALLLALLPGLNYVNCKASRSGIVHHSMQKSPKQRAEQLAEQRAATAIATVAMVAAAVYLFSLCWLKGGAGVCSWRGLCIHAHIHI